MERESLDVLPQIMKIPAQPLKTKWILTQGHRNVTALFLFSEKDYQFITENSRAWDKRDNETYSLSGEDFYHNWLPEEAREGIEAKTLVNGSYKLMNIQSYDPDMFYLEGGRYVFGQMIALKNNYILVSLWGD